MAQNIILQAQSLTKELGTGRTKVEVLRGVDLEIRAGEVIGIVGPSGSGKSTLLGLLGGLDSPTTGRIVIDGTDITDMGENQLTDVRNEKIGFVFQFFNLITTLTALENVALPVQFSRHRQFKPEQRARELLTMLGLSDRLRHRPTELSGGEQQRVAIARALANNPPLLLADEPTGNLDTKSGEVVMGALQQVREKVGTSVIVVTHDPEIAKLTDRVLTLVDGRFVNGIVG